MLVTIPIGSGDVTAYGWAASLVATAEKRFDHWAADERGVASLSARRTVND